MATIEIPVVEVATTDEEGNPKIGHAPASPIPGDALAVVCDGAKYTVTMPDPPEPSP